MPGTVLGTYVDKPLNPHGKPVRNKYCYPKENLRNVLRQEYTFHYEE